MSAEKRCLIAHAACVLLFFVIAIVFGIETPRTAPEPPKPQVFVFEPVPYPKAIEAEEDPTTLEYAYEVNYIIDGKPYSVFARAEAEKDRLLEYLEAIE